MQVLWKQVTITYLPRLFLQLLTLSIYSLFALHKTISDPFLDLGSLDNRSRMFQMGLSVGCDLQISLSWRSRAIHKLLDTSLYSKNSENLLKTSSSRFEDKVRETSTCWKNVYYDYIFTIFENHIWEFLHSSLKPIKSLYATLIAMIINCIFNCEKQNL